MDIPTAASLTENADPNKRPAFHLAHLHKLVEVCPLPGFPRRMTARTGVPADPLWIGVLRDSPAFNQTVHPHPQCIGRRAGTGRIPPQFSLFFSHFRV